MAGTPNEHGSEYVEHLNDIVGSGLANEVFGTTFELALDMFLIWHMSSSLHTCFRSLCEPLLDQGARTFGYCGIEIIGRAFW